MKRTIVLSLLLVTFFSSFAQKDWEVQKDEDGIMVWTKDYPNSKFKQFKAITTFTAELENVVAVFLDVTNMSAWYDRVAKVVLVEKFSEMEATYRIDFGLPWPVADRISAVRAIISYSPTDRVVRVNTKYEPGIVEGEDKTIITDMHSEWVLSQKADGKVEIFHIGYMDPAGTLPAWIVNSGVKEGPVKTLKALFKILPEYKDKKVAFLK